MCTGTSGTRSEFAQWTTGQGGMASLPPGLKVPGRANQGSSVTQVLSEAQDAMQRLVQSLQSGLADDKDSTFEYEDSSGQIQVGK